jgi:alpha-galactosidase
MEKIMDLMTQPHSFGAIKNISLHDLGYQDVGLDDCWQKCGAGYNGSYHTKKGDPIVDETKFPDLGGMVSYGHARNLTVGWYGNNCVCSEHGFSKEDVELQIKGDVNATLKYKFDGIKLDGCGQKLDLQKYVDLFKSHGKKIVIENCHWGNDLRTPNSCPYHFARMSQDIIRTWEGFFLNLQTMARGNGLSGPGCWGYPDMLVVGDMIGKYYESRAHFGAWCVTSSPLILSFDLTNTALLKDVWSIIAHKEAIAVNQAWDGDAGRLLYSWDPVDENTEDLPYYVWVLPCDDFDEEQQGWALKVHDEGAELRWRVEGVDVPICEVKHTKNLLRFPIEGSKLNNTNLGKKCWVIVVGIKGILKY